MSTENTYPPPVATLLTLGEPHARTDWPDYLAYGLTDEHIPALIEMAQDEQWYTAESESPEVWRRFMLGAP